jgi:hypothetical protein
MTQEFRTFTQRLTDELDKKTRIFNVQARTIVDRFGNDVVDSKRRCLWRTRLEGFRITRVHEPPNDVP